MSRSHTSPVVISTVGTVDLHEDLIFNHAHGTPLQMGDLVDLKTSKPSNAIVYGQARVTGYEGYDRGVPVKFKAIRIL